MVNHFTNSDLKIVRRQSSVRTILEPPPKVIQDFLDHYNRSHYYQVAKRARDLIEEELRKFEDLHVNVHFRAKKEESLEEKLYTRDADCHYENEEDIWNDIHDLAGVRIILYTPSEDQREAVERVIKTIWGDNVQHKDHEGSEDRTKLSSDTKHQAPEEHHGRRSYRSKHPGYTARHYRVKMRKHQERGNYTYKPRDRVEIQVVSALSHAWAEAGHDILYKSHEYGEPSPQERQLLDSLNGLVLSGDILLEQFYDLVVKRTKARFHHHYDFGIFLRELDILQPQELGDEPLEFDVEGLEVLFQFLRRIDSNYPIAVRNAFGELGFPHAPRLETYLEENIQPTFQPPKCMLAIICLLRHLLPPRSEDNMENVPLRRQCYIMINALVLLQTFFGNPKLTNTYLQDAPSMHANHKTGVQFVLTDIRRQLLLEKKPRDADYEAYEERIRGDMEPAWEWFNEEAKNESSIWGIAFRLAQMGATKEVEWTALLGRLSIGSILSRSPSPSIDGSVGEEAD